jgi:hypothetical protein
MVVRTREGFCFVFRESQQQRGRGGMYSKKRVDSSWYTEQEKVENSLETEP